MVTIAPDTLLKVLMLLNEKPRFAPRDRRLRFDSYSLASEIEAALKTHGIEPYAAMAALPRE